MIKQILRLPQIDSSEVPRYTFDESNNSVRVTIVAGDRPNLGEINGSSSPNITQYIPVVETKIERIEIPVVETRIERIEVPTIITEVKVVEIPVVVKEIEYREIEKHVYITEFKEIKVVEIVREKDLVYVDKFNYKALYITQAITLGLLVLSHFIK